MLMSGDRDLEPVGQSRQQLDSSQTLLDILH